MSKFISISIFWIFATGLTAHAQTDPEKSPFNFQSRDSVHRSTFLIGASLAQLQTEASSFQGFGVHLGYRYAVRPRWAITPALAQIYDMSNSGKSLYTSIAAAVDYAVSGGFIFGGKEYSSYGMTAIKISTPRESTFVLSLGFEQLFLSGSQSVYAAPGFTIGGGYSFQLFERFLNAQLKFGQYQNSDKPITGISLNVSTDFNL